MSTQHPIFTTRETKFTYPREIELNEHSCLFDLTIEVLGEDASANDMTMEELGVIAFRLLEVLSYYDPGFEVTFPKASHYVQTELRRVLK